MTLPDRLLTVPEASKLLGVSTQGLYNMISRREIPHVKIGKRVRFDPPDLEAWIEAQRAEPRIDPAAGRRGQC